MLLQSRSYVSRTDELTKVQVSKVSIVCSVTVSKRQGLDLKMILPCFTFKIPRCIAKQGRTNLLIFRITFHRIIIFIGIASKTCL